MFTEAGCFGHTLETSVIFAIEHIVEQSVYLNVCLSKKLLCAKTNENVVEDIRGIVHIQHTGISMIQSIQNGQRCRS